MPNKQQKAHQKLTKKVIKSQKCYITPLLRKLLIVQQRLTENSWENISNFKLKEFGAWLMRLKSSWTPPKAKVCTEPRDVSRRVAAWVIPNRRHCLQLSRISMADNWFWEQYSTCTYIHIFNMCVNTVDYYIYIWISVCVCDSIK